MVAWAGQALALRAAVSLGPPVWAVMFAILVEAAVVVVALTVMVGMRAVPVGGGAELLSAAGLAGLFGIAGYYLYGQALVGKATGVITALAAMYPVLVTVLALALFREAVSVRQWFAIVLAVLAAMLVVKP